MTLWIAVPFLLTELAAAVGVGYCAVRWWRFTYTLTLALAVEWLLWSAAIEVWFGGTLT